MRNTIVDDIWYNLYVVMYNLNYTHGVIDKIKRYNLWAKIIIAIMASSAVASVLSGLADIPNLTVAIQIVTLIMAIVTIIIIYHQFPESLSAYSTTALHYLELEKEYINLWHNWGNYEGNDIEDLKKDYIPIQEKHYLVKRESLKQKNDYQLKLSKKEEQIRQDAVDYKLQGIGFM